MSLVANDIQDKFRKKIKIIDSGCWLWLGSINKVTGYGYIGYRENGKQKMSSAHRYAYTIFRGQIPQGLVLDHKCNIKQCVNPNHLEAVTQYENLKRAGFYSSINKSKQKCPRGHPYSNPNDSHRICKICKFAQSRTNNITHSNKISRYEASENINCFIKTGANVVSLDEFSKKFGKRKLEQAVKQLLLLDGIDCYTKSVIHTRRFIEKTLDKQELYELAKYMKLDITRARLRKDHS